MQSESDSDNEFFDAPEKLSFVEDSRWAVINHERIERHKFIVTFLMQFFFSGESDKNIMTLL